MKRRAFLAGCAATGFYAPALAAAKASRRFTVLRDGEPMGEHVLDAVQAGDGFEIAIDISLKVKVLGITAYRYEMTNREIWKGGRLVSLNSKVNDDGTEDFATAQVRCFLDIQADVTRRAFVQRRPRYGPIQVPRREGTARSIDPLPEHGLHHTVPK